MFFNTAQGAAALSLLANMTLVGLKLGVGFSIGSISVLSDALDSGMDLVGAAIALVAVRFAARPADPGHPYGHGKVENFSGIAESFLILAGAGLISAEAVRRLREGVEVQNVDLGIVAMAISMAINISVSWHLIRVARRTHSIALQATAWHRASDILTSLGVLIGLIVLAFSPWEKLDPAVALAVAAFVVWTAVRLFRRAYGDLLDASLPEAEAARVRQILEDHAGEFVNYHSLRTRRSGAFRYIDVHVVLPRVTTVAEAHELTDRLEGAIERAMPNTLTTIHVEPCEVPQERCNAECPLRPVPHCASQPRAAQGAEHTAR
jgi:cation diffusion facilitator family transporter